ncbi:MAG TPA: hypothetical protein VF811_15520 [Parasulfuritortus sp.]
MTRIKFFLRPSEEPSSLAIFRPKFRSGETGTPPPQIGASASFPHWPSRAVGDSNPHAKHGKWQLTKIKAPAADYLYFSGTVD